MPSILVTRPELADQDQRGPYPEYATSSRAAVSRDLSSVEAFLEKMVSAGGEAAKAMLVAKIRSKLEPIANKQGLVWSDVASVVALIDELSELQSCLSDPSAFLSKLASASGPAAKKMILATMRAKMRRGVDGVPTVTSWHPKLRSLTLRVARYFVLTEMVFTISGVV